MLGAASVLMLNAVFSPSPIQSLMCVTLYLTLVLVFAFRESSKFIVGGDLNMDLNALLRI